MPPLRSPLPPQQIHCLWPVEQKARGHYGNRTLWITRRRTSAAAPLLIVQPQRVRRWKATRDFTARRRMYHFSLDKNTWLFEHRSVLWQLSPRRIINLRQIVSCWEIKEGFSVSRIFDTFLSHQLFRFIPSLTKTSLDPAEPQTLLEISFDHFFLPGPLHLTCEKALLFSYQTYFSFFQFDGKTKN